ncbi:MAG: ATP-binding protein [Bacteroidota bacterium]
MNWQTRIRIFLRISILTCCLGSGWAWAQGDIGAIRKEIANSSGLKKLQLYNQLAGAYFPQSPTQTINAASKVLELASGTKNQTSPEDHGKIMRCEVDANNWIGQAWMEEGRNQRAKGYFKRAEEMASNIGYVKGITTANTHLEEIRQKGFKLVDAVEGLINDEEIKEAVGQIKTGGRLLSLEGQAEIAYNKGEYEEAINYFLRMIPILQANSDTARISKTYYRISDAFTALGRIQQADEYAALASGRKAPIVLKPDETSAPPGEPEDADQTQEETESFLAEMEEIIGQEEKMEATILAKTQDLEAQKGEALREAERLERTGNKVAARQKIAEARGYQNQIYALEKQREDAAKKMDKMREEIEQLSVQNELKEEKNNYLILSLSLLTALMGLIAYLLFSKRISHRQLTNAYEELEDTHQQLISTQTQLVTAEKMASLGQLTAGIAHEINNPVNFISGNIDPLKEDISQLLSILQAYEEKISQQRLENSFSEVEQLKQEMELDYVKEEIQALLEGIEEGASRTTEIVKGLRTFARVDEGQPKTFDLQAGIESTLSLLKNQLQGIDVIHDFADIPQIEGYPGKLNQVFMNLLTNAIQAMPKGGWIRISTKDLGEAVEIRIQDTGKGFPAADRHKIFEPFYTTKSIGEGTGLGLSISLGIIEQHHGTIEIDSMEGHGTEAVIVLPKHFRLG